MSTEPIVVFLGPTLKLERAQNILDAVYLQPAAQGDVLLAAHEYHPRAMVLIDGHFEDRPAVRHKEIMWAMAQGITMIGAASMGALRAAELQSVGMIGVGLIYRWYRRYPLLRDDAVAVQSGPRDTGFLPLTDSLVDLRRTFSELRRTKLITSAERDRMTVIAARLNFRERTIGTVVRKMGWQAGRIEMFRKRLICQKTADAVLVLQLASTLSNQYKQFGLHDLIITNTFLRDLEASGIDIELLSIYKQ